MALVASLSTTTNRSDARNEVLDLAPGYGGRAARREPGLYERRQRLELYLRHSRDAVALREHGRRSCAGRAEKRGGLRALSFVRRRLHRASRSPDCRPAREAPALPTRAEGAGAAKPCAGSRAPSARFTAFCVSSGFARRECAT